MTNTHAKRFNDCLISRKELARRLGISIKTVDRMRKDLKLPAVLRLGRIVRFHWPMIVKRVIRPKKVSSPKR
jgi:predicted DNA-binding transcriptional regulator AlpA